MAATQQQQQQQQQQPAGIIKTTARFQETLEPLRQKPIIQIDPSAPLQQYENLARASIDSGRDNPFRPDGKIYRSADPIVDYYKFGPNQSRTQSPTDSRLLIGAGDLDDDDDLNNEEVQGDGKKKSGKKGRRRKKRKDVQKGGDSTGTRKPCWRRWFCCCCCCFEEGGCCRRKKKGGVTDERIDEKFDTSQYDSPPSVNAKIKDFKQSKIVVLQTSEHEDNLPSGEGGTRHSDQSTLRIGQNGSHHDRTTTTTTIGTTDTTQQQQASSITTTTTDQKLLAAASEVEPKNQQQHNHKHQAKATEPKKTSKKCVIS